jgi:hypothetical protein
MPDHSYIETPQQQRERRGRQSAGAAAENDPMAVERLRTLLTEAARGSGYDPYVNGAAGDPDMVAEAVLNTTVVDTARFEREVNEHGVPMRRLVVTGEWEMDPNGAASYTGERWEQLVCCERHDDAGEAEACCEYCPNRLPLRIVEKSPAEAVDWHRHTYDMWVGEGYGAKVLVEVDPGAISRRVKWRARVSGVGVISDAPRTLAEAKRDGTKYLWSRRTD